MDNCKNIKFLSLIFIAIFFSTIVIGQNKSDSSRYIIQGKVFDISTKEILYYATVMLNNKNVTSTNANGNFSLTLPSKYLKKKFKIHVTAIGYNEKTFRINNKKNSLTLDLNAYLTKAKIDMNQVIRIQ